MLIVYLVDLCHAALSRQIICVVLAFNITTDLYLLSIPVPMLWGVKMPILKKGGIMLLFSGGIIVIVFAALRCTAILSVSAKRKNGIHVPPALYAPSSG